jgi:ECF transporter S component (folate family)
MFKISIRQMTYSAFLVVLSIILTRFFSYNIPFFGFPSFSIELGGVPIIAGGILFGPVIGAIIGLLSDIIGFMINNRGGAYFFGFTLNSMLTGIIPGLLFYLIKKIKQDKKNLFWVVFVILIALDVTGTIYLSTVDKVITSKTAIDVTSTMRIIAISILNVSTIISIYSIYRLKTKYLVNVQLYSIDKVVLSILLVEILVYIPLTPLWLSMLYNTPPLALGTLVLLRVVRAAFIIFIKTILVYTLIKTAQVIKKTEFKK